MGNVVRAQLGGHVPIRVKARERRSDSLNGRLDAVLGMSIKRIVKPDGTTIASASLPRFAYVVDGEGVAQWDTSGLTAGDYLVEIEAVTGYDSVAGANVTAPKVITIRLLNKGAP